MNTPIQELASQAAAIQAKQATNTRAIKAARENSDRARDAALDTETEEARQDFRAALLEVESFEMLEKELNRKAAYVAEQIKTAQREQAQQDAREQLASRADAYAERKAQAFDLRAQVAAGFQHIPTLWDELRDLEVEAAQLADAAKTLGDERAGDFAGDANILLWQSRNAIAGGFPGFAEPVHALFNAVAFDRAQPDRDLLLERQGQHLAATTRDAKTPAEIADEAAALERYWQGARDRNAVFAFQNWQREQKQVEIDAENIRVAMQAPAQRIRPEELKARRQEALATGATS